MITATLDYPKPIGFLFANNAFGTMTMEELHSEEHKCSCHEFNEFKSIPDCDHVITTDPRILKDSFPALYKLCKKGCKYRIQTEQATEDIVYKAIERFAALMERKYGRSDNELMS